VDLVSGSPYRNPVGRQPSADSGFKNKNGDSDRGKGLETFFNSNHFDERIKGVLEVLMKKTPTFLTIQKSPPKKSPVLLARLRFLKISLCCRPGPFPPPPPKGNSSPVLMQLFYDLSNNPDAFRQHQASHDGFVAKAAELQQKFKTGNLTLSVDTLTYPGDWVKKHILETDKNMGAFLHAQGLA